MLSAESFCILIVLTSFSQTTFANTIYPGFIDEFKARSICPPDSYLDSGIRVLDRKKTDKEAAVFHLCKRIFILYQSFNISENKQKAEKFYDLIQQVEFANNNNALEGRFNNILNKMKEKLIARHGKRQKINLRGESLGAKGAILLFLDEDEKVLYERAFSYNGSNLEKKDTEYRLVEESYSGDKKYIRFIMPGSEINNARKICDKNIPVFKAAPHDSGWSGFEFGGIRENTKYYLNTSQYSGKYGANYPVIIANAYEILKESYNLSDESPSDNIDFCAELAQLGSLSVSRSADLESHADSTYSSDGCEEGRDMYVSARKLMLRSEPVKNENSKLYYNQDGSAILFQFLKCEKITVIKEYTNKLEEKENIEWMKISKQCALKHIPDNSSSPAKFKYKSGKIYEKEFMYVGFREDSTQFFLSFEKPNDCPK